MSRRRLTLWSVVVLLLAAATWLRPPPPQVFAERMRALARPLALPLLWRGLAYARNEEPPEAIAARGQQVLALLPQWTDGHILFASQLAFAASTRAADSETAALRVLAALAMLEAAIATHPPGELDCLSAMASFVEIRASQDPALAAALQRHLGVEPQVAADGFLARAEARSPSASISDRRTYLLLAAIASALRTDDNERALATIASMRHRLTTTIDRELAQRWQDALARLAGYLNGDSRITLQSLKDDPLLQDMVADLPSGRR